MTDTMKVRASVDHDCTLLIRVPEIGAVLAAMPAEEKARLLCYMACDDVLFDKVVDILADGFCTPETEDVPDWRWWSPANEKTARERLLSKMPDVVDRRVTDLESKVRSLEASLELERSWKRAHRQAHEQHHRDGSSDAHIEAAEIVNAMAREAAARESGK